MTDDERANILANRSKPVDSVLVVNPGRPYLRKQGTHVALPSTLVPKMSKKLERLKLRPHAFFDWFKANGVGNAEIAGVWPHLYFTVCDPADVALMKSVGLLIPNTTRGRTFDTMIDLTPFETGKRKPSPEPEEATCPIGPRVVFYDTGLIERLEAAGWASIKLPAIPSLMRWGQPRVERADPTREGQTIVSADQALIFAPDDFLDRLWTGEYALEGEWIITADDQGGDATLWTQDQHGATLAKIAA